MDATLYNETTGEVITIINNKVAEIERPILPRVPRPTTNMAPAETPLGLPVMNFGEEQPPLATTTPANAPPQAPGEAAWHVNTREPLPVLPAETEPLGLPSMDYSK